MAKKAGRWIRWGAVGCGGVVLAFVATFVITTLLTGLGPQENRSAADTLKDARQLLSTPFLIGRDLGDYVSKRNEVLLANEMGLGEYTWIYVITYHAWLGRPRARLFATADRPGIYDQRVDRQIGEMVARHVARGATVDRDEWQAEADAFATDPTRIVFHDGLPPALAASLEPYRQEMVALDCPAAGELEVVLTIDTGAWYDHR